MSQTKKITSDMMHSLKYDKRETAGANIPTENLKWTKPGMLIVFDDGDLNAAAYHAAESARHPFETNAIATVLVQESVFKSFTDKLINNLEKLDPDVYKHPRYLHSLNMIQRLKARTFEMKESLGPKTESPIFVVDFIQNYFNEGPSGVITMNVFRTAKEAQTLYYKQAFDYKSCTIYNEKMTCAYELVMLIACPIFYLNCHLVPLDPVQKYYNDGVSHVVIDGKYHYECVEIDEKFRIVVFSIGTIFAN